MPIAVVVDRLCAWNVDCAPGCRQAGAIALVAPHREQDLRSFLVARRCPRLLAEISFQIRKTSTNEFFSTLKAERFNDQSMQASERARECTPSVLVSSASVIILIAVAFERRSEDQRLI